MSLQKIISLITYNIRKIIIFSGGVTVIVFLILFFVFPITYTNTVRVLPPEEMNGMGLQSLIGSSDVSALLGGSSAAEEISQLYAEISRSRTAGEFVLNNSELPEYYDESDYRRIFPELNDDMEVMVTKEGLIELSFTTKTPLFSRFTDVPDSMNNLAAKIANLYITGVDSINRAKLNIKARNSRIYIENQLDKTHEQLMDAQRKLTKFQSDYKTIALESQVEAAIENAAEIKAQIIASEIQLKTYEYNVQQNSREYQSLVKKIEVLRDKYNSMKIVNDDNRDYLPAFDDVPEIQSQFADLTREVKIYNEVYLLLQKQFFAESIQENKNVPTMEVLDPAIPSVKPKGPRLVFHSVVSGIFAFIFISFLVVMKEVKMEKARKEIE